MVNVNIPGIFLQVEVLVFGGKEDCIQFLILGRPVSLKGGMFLQNICNILIILCKGGPHAVLVGIRNEI